MSQRVIVHIPLDIVGVEALKASFCLAFKGHEVGFEGEEADSLHLVGISPSPSGLKQGRTVKGRLMASGIPEDSVWTVLMGAGTPGGLDQKLAEEAVGRFRGSLSYAPALLLQAELDNVSVLDRHPQSRLAQEILGLAGAVEKWWGLDRPANNPTGELIEKLEEEVVLRLAPHAHREDPGPFIDEEVQRYLSEKGRGAWDPELIAALKQKMKDRLLGWGPLGPWFRDESVNEIMVNGSGRLFVEREGVMAEEKSPFKREEELRWVIDRLTSQAGRRVDFSSPLCDVRLKDGSRLNVILPPLSLAGPVLTIRKFRRQLRTLEDLIARGTITVEESRTLARAVQEKKNIVIAGNTGAGKTTLLNVLSGAIPVDERVITLEDTAELQLSHPHVISLEARQKNTEGEGQISLNDLVLNALRMRPDRLIIGECRGLEVLSLLQAMNTGHDGAMTTLHANSAADAVQRLEGMVLLGAPRWPIEVVRQQIASAIDLIVFIKREGGRRVLKEMVEL